MAMFSKIIYIFNTILIKIPVGPLYNFFAKIDKLMLKFIWKFKGPRKLNTILKKVGGFIFPNFKT